MEPAGGIDVAAERAPRIERSPLCERGRRWLRRWRRGRAVDIFDDDLLLVSYPKSGNTWMRYLIGNLIHAEASFANLEDLIPDIYHNRNGRLLGLPRPRVMKSHEPYDPRYRRVVYIVRDPRSVFLSYYKFALKYRTVAAETTMEAFSPWFLDDRIYGPWDEHVNSWTKTLAPERIVVVRYEDLLDDAGAQLRRIAAAFGLDEGGSDARIEAAVERSSFDNMRKDERALRADAAILAGSDHAKPFVRSGRKDEWREVVPRELLDAIDGRFSATMAEHGYAPRAGR